MTSADGVEVYDRIESDVLLEAGKAVRPGCLNVHPDIVVTWKGFEKHGDAKGVEFLVNGSSVGLGPAGWRAVAKNLASASEGATVLFYPCDYFNLWVHEKRGRVVPYHAYPTKDTQEIVAAVKARKLRLFLMSAPGDEALRSIDDWLREKQATWNLAGIRNFGINLGSTRDRFENTDNTTWFSDPNPAVGATYPSPLTWCEFLPPRDKLETFFEHPLFLQENCPIWVCTSGVRGLDRLRIHFDDRFPKHYTVRLYFSEQDPRSANNVFDVYLQGNRVLQGFDVHKEVTKAYQPVIKEFHGIKVRDSLDLTMKPIRGKTVLCGIQVRREAE
jgi:hypothetical protein